MSVRQEQWCLPQGRMGGWCDRFYPVSSIGYVWSSWLSSSLAHWSCKVEASRGDFPLGAIGIEALHASWRCSCSQSSRGKDVGLGNRMNIVLHVWSRPRMYPVLSHVSDRSMALDEPSGERKAPNHCLLTPNSFQTFLLLCSFALSPSSEVCAPDHWHALVAFNDFVFYRIC